MTPNNPSGGGLDTSLKQPPTFVHFGTKIIEMDAARGFVKAEFPARANFCNPAGVMQGGFLTAFSDEIMSLSAVVATNFEKIVPTLELKASFLAPVLPGKIIVEGEAIRLGRQIGFLEGRLYNPAGELAVTASSTVRLREWIR